jgi:hypothetical protein
LLGRRAITVTVNFFPWSFRTSASDMFLAASLVNKIYCNTCRCFVCGAAWKYVSSTFFLAKGRTHVRVSAAFPPRSTLRAFSFHGYHVNRSLRARRTISSCDLLGRLNVLICVHCGRTGCADYEYNLCHVSGARIYISECLCGSKTEIYPSFSGFPGCLFGLSHCSSNREAHTQVWAAIPDQVPSTSDGEYNERDEVS